MSTSRLWMTSNSDCFNHKRSLYKARFHHHNSDCSCTLNSDCLGENSDCLNGKRSAVNLPNTSDCSSTKTWTVMLSKILKIWDCLASTFAQVRDWVYSTIGKFRTVYELQNEDCLYAEIESLHHVRLGLFVDCGIASKTSHKHNNFSQNKSKKNAASVCSS